MTNDIVKAVKRVPLEHGRVICGKPLPFDLFDERGRCLLKQGSIIENQDKLDRLIGLGVFFDDVVDLTSQSQKTVERLSVYLRVGELASTFERLIDKKEPEYSEALNIAGHIQELCELDSDAALANVHLQKSGKYSLRHSFRTAVMTEILLKRLDRPAEIRRYAVAGALTMNICMLELQDLLYSQDIPLTLEQKRAILMHPQVAIDVLRKQSIDHPIWLDVVEHHHELIDGSGYAKRLLKSDLNIEPQVVSLADRFSAMVSEREYRPGLLPSLAVKNLLSRQSHTIEPSVASAFLKEIGIYPPGTVVSLANGEVAVVVKRLLKPEYPLVRSLRSAKGVRYTEFPKRLTSTPAFAIKETLPAEKATDFDLSTLWRPIELDETDDETLPV